MPRLGRAAVLGAAWSLLAPQASGAQFSATLDLGASRVEYDGFLPSAAWSVSPAIRVSTPQTSFAARGTWLGFESGNTSIQGLLAGSLFTPMAGRWRGEVTATAGVSSYEALASFTHALARGRLHMMRRGGGFWLGGTFGQASYDSGNRPVAAVSAGVWQGQRNLNFTIALAATRVGDTAYVDVEWSGNWQRGRFELEGLLGARGGRGGGHGVYGEAVGTVSLSHSLAATLGWGRYPTDPIRGSVSGRYLSVGVRLAGFTPRTVPRSAPAWSQAPIIAVAGSNGHSITATAAIALEAAGPILVVRAPGAAFIEVKGDFTDWEPVELARVRDVFRLDTPLPSGVRRFNVRVDGGAWVVPAGATLEHDDFGATVATLVVP